MLPLQTEVQSQGRRALESIEDPAQLLSLRKSGTSNRERGGLLRCPVCPRERPSYPHPAMVAVLDPTCGQVMYAGMWTFQVDGTNRVTGDPVEANAQTD